MEPFHQADWGDRFAIAAQIEDPSISELACPLGYP